MRLGFDATALGPAGKGMARFQGEFLRAAAAFAPPPDLTVFVAETAPEEELPRVPGWRYVRVDARPSLVWQQLRLPRAARRAGVDLVLTLAERAPLWGPPRAMYVFEHPRHRTELNRRNASLRQRLVDRSTLALFPAAARRAAVVLAASASTAHDLEPVARATVVHSGVSSTFRPDEARAAAIREELGAPEGYVLHVGSDDPRDNSRVALAAYALADVPVPLVVAGPLRDTLAARLDEIDELGIADRTRLLGFSSGERLADLYRGAIAYVDPSLYEGFGLQTAEALACGTPAIASNRTSLPEVVGDGGILLEPNDVEGFAGAIRRLWRDEPLRTELEVRAAAQGARFTWERTVRETLDACRAALLSAPPPAAAAGS